MRRVHLRRIAKRDLRDALTWYSSRDPDLASRFLNEVYKALAMLERFPNSGGPVYGVMDPATRQLPVDTFPYQIVFKRYPDRISVLAIAHERKRPARLERRRPGGWLGGVPPPLSRVPRQTG